VDLGFRENQNFGTQSPAGSGRFPQAELFSQVFDHDAKPCLRVLHWESWQSECYENQYEAHHNLKQ